MKENDDTSAPGRNCCQSQFILPAYWRSRQRERPRGGSPQLLRRLLRHVCSAIQRELALKSRCGPGLHHRKGTRRRTLYTANFVVFFRAHVPNEFIPINPLGMTITYFREDKAFK